MNLYLKLGMFFATLITIGWVATLSLFNFSLIKFKKSELYIKVLMWIPFALIFILIYAAPDTIQLLSLCILTGAIFLEWLRIAGTKKFNYLSSFFMLFSVIGMLHIAAIKSTMLGNQLWLSLAVGTVLSDVFAFFFGKIIGKHKLPEFINSKKSWEGAFGQIVGAVLGVVLVKFLFFREIPFIVAIPIGLGSLAGDLLNSRVKRLFGIKNWSSSLPGHGGLIDRLSSMGGSALFLYYFLALALF